MLGVEPLQEKRGVLGEKHEVKLCFTNKILWGRLISLLMLSLCPLLH